ncbi:transcriptional regulator GcvA [Epibacterium sp. SM1979]|uniref:Transcriptional regulator GcvA n=1 Tax=Tritonibacter litoralis TaxID=2662264 RepID=A0A843YI80_9RHOB|nr:transcriptional regulator GcvA [Tritonibacter litoralis]MQQ09144.1 transcriptional regulator GcvA [Tritonibacter litoralis]
MPHSDRPNRLPPLKALQAFESAARHLSFKLAAEELCVTPTAISHQVKALEDYLGVKLFHRLTRSLRLTGEGEAYARLVIQGFQKLAEASNVLGSDEVKGELVVSTTTSFAGQWLAHRLPEFLKEYPGLSVRILSSDTVTDFARDGIDVAIRYGFGEYKDFHAAWVLDDFAAPVCTKEISAQLQQPSDLLDQPLVNYEWSRFSKIDPSWAKWFHAAGVKDVSSSVISTFSDAHMCLQAARDGHGVALVSVIAAARDLEHNQLEMPFDIKLKDKSYYLVCPPANFAQAKVRVFQEWILAQADLFRDSEIGLRVLDGGTG